ncbi:MAG TPA: hypothetical protein VJ249_07975 [Candidatus Bathyarchaeia archaeon]|nr:hypothetical protein [Candidatus Bathyarchaeia archaeon]
MKKVILGVVLPLLLTSMLMSAFNIRATMSSEPPATDWSKTYGGTGEDSAYSVIQTSDGGYALGGRTTSYGAGNYDFWLVKTDSVGNMLWNRTYGGANVDQAESLVQTSDGGYALVGYTYSFGAGGSDWWLVKTDSSGNELWSRTYGGTNNDYPYCLIETIDGGYALAGATASYGAGDSDFWLVKTDSYGNIEWNYTYGGEEGDVAQPIVQTRDGGYALLGYSGGYGDPAKRDVWLVKTDSSGIMQWNKRYGGAGEEMGREIVETRDGGYAIAAFTTSYGAGNKDFWLIKTDAAGSWEWDRTYGGGAEDQAFSLVDTDDGGYALAGYTASYGAGEWDFWLVKTDLSGTMEWNQTYGGTNRDQAISMIKTGDGGYAIAGFTNSFGAGSGDFWLIKLAGLAPPVISATIDVDPNTLNLKSNGQWITAYITLPEGYSVEDILLETVEVDGISAAWSDIQNSVYMAKFDRATVQTYLTNEPDYETAPKFYDITLTVTGGLTDGTLFEGTDTITVIKK